MTDEELLIDDEILEEDHNLVLTTNDNPHNPKLDYGKWKRWDEDHNYNTESYIARLVDMEEGSDTDDELQLEKIRRKVIIDILEHDVLNVYTLV